MTGAIWASVAIAAATMFVTWTNRHRKVVMLMVAPLYGLAIIAGILYFTHDRQNSLDREHQLAVTLYERQVEEHETCLAAARTRVDSREALRGQLIAVVVNGATRSIRQAEGLRTAVLAIIPESADAQAAMDNYVELASSAAVDSIDLAHESQDVDYPSLNLEVEQAKCVPPGTEPANPGD